MKIKLVLSAVLFFMLASPLLAGEELNYNIINLHADADRQVENDVMVVGMSAQSETNSAVEAAENVNKMMSWAAAIAAKSDGVKSQTLNYQTRPLYKNKALIGWSVNQQIRFESKEFGTLSTLVGTLQEKLRVDSMQFVVSPERQRATMTELIVVVLGAFREKATLVTATLGGRDYRLVNLSIRQDSPIAPYQRAYQAEVMSAQAAPPHVEAGDSRVNIRVEGSIQLIF